MSELVVCRFSLFVATDDLWNDFFAHCFDERFEILWIYWLQSLDFFEEIYHTGPSATFAAGGIGGIVTGSRSN